MTNDPVVSTAMAWITFTSVRSGDGAGVLQGDVKGVVKKGHVMGGGGGK